jgi:hypothetical protein
MSQSALSHELEGRTTTSGASLEARVAHRLLGGVLFSVEAGGQPLPERAEPQLVEDQEPEFRQYVIANA